ncbi:hypothetical protein DFJ73DRAFT_820400 [Zopfochytrium polystomum]|nr:hypothetical protein DFJ73DRAFT_820400 [Zopfochytrium polystomum]
MISPPSSSFPPGFTTAPVSGHPLGLFGFLRVALADPNASYGYVDCNVPSNPTLWLAYVLVLSHNVLSLLSFSAFHPSPSSPSYSPTVDGPVVTLGDTPEDSIHIDHATSFRLGVAAAPLTGPTLIVDTNIPSNRVRWVFRCHTHHSLPPPSGLESMRSITSLESWLAVLRGKSLLSRRSRSVDTGLSSAAATPTSLASAGVADYSQGRAGMRRTSESSSNNFWPGIREREALPPAPKSAGSSVGLWLRRKKSRETLPRENLTRSNSAKPAVPRSSMETAPATRVVNPPRPPQQQQQQSAPHQKAYPQQPMPQEQQLSAFTNLPPPLSAMPSFNGNRMYQYSPSLGSANFPMATAPTTAHGPSSGILPTVPIAPKADYYTSIAARMMRKYSSDPPSDRENTITNQPGLPSNHSTSSTSLSTLPPAHSRNETPTSSASQPSSVSRYNTAPPSLQSGTSSALTSPASTAVFTTRQPSPASEVDDGTLTRQKWSDDEDRFLRLMYQQDAYALLDRMPTTPIPLLPPPRKQSADGFKSAPARLAGPAPPQATVSLPEPFQFKPPSTPYLSAAQTPSAMGRWRTRGGAVL